MYQKHKETVCGFLLNLLDFVNNDISINVVTDEESMYKSFMKLMRNIIAVLYQLMI